MFDYKEKDNIDNIIDNMFKDLGIDKNETEKLFDEKIKNILSDSGNDEKIKNILSDSGNVSNKPKPNV